MKNPALVGGVFRNSKTRQSGTRISGRIDPSSVNPPAMFVRIFSRRLSGGVRVSKDFDDIYRAEISRSVSEVTFSRRRINNLQTTKSR